jgi:hypothetical protein
VFNVKLEALAPLPPLFGDISCSNFIECATISALVVTKISNERRDELWLESIDNLLWHNSLSHAGSCERRDAVNFDVALFTLLRK